MTGFLISNSDVEGEDHIWTVCICGDGCYDGFGRGKGILALALGINEAFNSVLPEVLINYLRYLEVPGRLLNVISFLISTRNLFFASNSSDQR